MKGTFNVEQTINFEKLAEGVPEKLRKLHDTTEPNTLEISYTYDAANGGTRLSEVVYEDPAEGSKRPRLLVSLTSVLALKQLCEREFLRQEVLTNMLHQCRCGYYKELLWLREQLLLASRPEPTGQLLKDAVGAYEVYWFDPTQYVNEELREFMQECNRETNRRLIEENYMLQMKLGGKSLEDYEDPAAALQRVLKKWGPAKVARAGHAYSTSKEFGSREQEKELEDFALEIAKTLGWAKWEPPVEKAAAPPPEQPKEDHSKCQAEIDALKQKVAEADGLRERLKSALADAEGLKKALDEAQKALEEAQKALAAETARAEQERRRADAERARAEKAEKEIQLLKTKLNQPAKPATSDRGFDALRAAADKCADRINTCVSSLSRLKTFAGAAPTPPASPLNAPAAALEQASAALEDLVQGAAEPTDDGAADAAAKAIAKLHAAVAELQAKVANLEAQLKEAREAERRAKAEAEEALRRAEEAARAAQRPASEAVHSGIDPEEMEKAREAELKARERAEKAEQEVRELRKLVEEKDAELAALRKELAKLKAQLAAAGGGTEELLARISELEEKAKERENKIQELEEMYDNVCGKLGRAQDRILELKAEIRQLKIKLGMDPNDDDEEEDFDLPNFLTPYYKRNRNSDRPRWTMLSEDAKLGRMKREYVYTQKNVVVAQAANSAFQFLQAGAGSSSRQPPQKKQSSREHSPEAIKAFMQAYENPPSPAHAAGARGCQASISSITAFRGPSDGSRSPSPTQAAMQKQVTFSMTSASRGLPDQLGSLSATPTSAAVPVAGSREQMQQQLLQLQWQPQQQQQRRPSQSRAASKVLQQPTGQRQRSSSPQLQDFLSLGPTGAGIEVLPPQVLASAAAAAASAAAATATRQGRVPVTVSHATTADPATLAMSLHVAAMCGWTPPMRLDGRSLNPSTQDKLVEQASPQQPRRASPVEHVGQQEVVKFAPIVVRSLGPAPEAFAREIRQGAAAGRAEPETLRPPASWSPVSIVTATQDAPADAVCAAAPRAAQPRVASPSLEDRLIAATSAVVSPTAPASRQLVQTAEGTQSAPTTPAVVSLQVGSSAPPGSAGSGRTPLGASMRQTSNPVSPSAAGGGRTPVGAARQIVTPASPTKTVGLANGALTKGKRDLAMSQASTTFGHGDMMMQSPTSTFAASSSMGFTMKPSYSMPFKVAPPSGGQQIGLMKRASSTSGVRALPNQEQELSEGHFPTPPEQAALASTGALGAPSPKSRAPRSRGDPPVPWGRSRSTAALPLTNSGPAAAGAQAGKATPCTSPTKAKAPSKTALAADTGDDGHLPGVLPPLPQGTVRKAQPSPSWLVATVS